RLPLGAQGQERADDVDVRNKTAADTTNEAGPHEFVDIAGDRFGALARVAERDARQQLRQLGRRYRRVAPGQVEHDVLLPALGWRIAVPEVLMDEVLPRDAKLLVADDAELSA